MVHNDGMPAVVGCSGCNYLAERERMLVEEVELLRRNLDVLIDQKDRVDAILDSLRGVETQLRQRADLHRDVADMREPAVNSDGHDGQSKAYRESWKFVGEIADRIAEGKL